MVALVTIQLIRVRSCVRPLVRFRAEWFRLRFLVSVRPSSFLTVVPDSFRGVRPSPFVHSDYGFVSVRPSSFAFVLPEFPEPYLFVAFRRRVRSRYCCRISSLRVSLLHRPGVAVILTAASTHVARSVFEIPLTILKKKNMRSCCSAAGGCAFVLFLGLK
ncbi:unnamed protein product [Sphagnum jensenii]|uniref:Uncharacterized protein n=1 Tax=Sphagnum jensenii TaxID=128206 RepID=A0ABP1AS48_9BRYO